ncbi:hypothetical protein ACSBR1_030009 [Camellia fascicularis]
MDEALRVRASLPLPCTIDGASSSYVSRMKRKRKTVTTQTRPYGFSIVTGQ